MHISPSRKFIKQFVFFSPSLSSALNIILIRKSNGNRNDGLTLWWSLFFSLAHFALSTSSEKKKRVKIECGYSNDITSNANGFGAYFNGELIEKRARFG